MDDHPADPRAEIDEQVRAPTGDPFPPPPTGALGWPWTDDDETPLVPVDRVATAARVTVVTPSYNQGEYLEEAIRSIILQDHPNLEYIVMDGGSNDQSTSIIERYSPWITHWVSEPDDGQADAINRGFERATGDYLCWLNADDVLYQGFVSRRVEEFATRPTVDLIYGDIDSGWNRAERSILPGEPPSFLDMLRTLKVEVPQQGAMWRRSAVERLGGLDPRWHVVLDREFFLRLIHHGVAEYIPGRCGFFRQHPGAKSVAEATAWVDELPRMYRELFADPDLEQEAKGLERETMANVHLMCSDIVRSTGDWRRSLVELGRAVRWSPAHAIASFAAARATGLRRRLSIRDRGSSRRQTS
jgi:glycosyltransferase involved in cell wall biosynthesis